MVVRQGSPSLFLDATARANKAAGFRKASGLVALLAGKRLAAVAVRATLSLRATGLAEGHALRSAKGRASPLVEITGRRRHVRPRVAASRTRCLVGVVWGRSKVTKACRLIWDLPAHLGPPAGPPP